MSAGDRPSCDAQRVLILFPGGLGDFLCCWTALQGLRAATGARLTVVAPGPWLDVLLPGDVQRLSIDRREVADLFAVGPIAPSTRELFGGHGRVESWTGHGNAVFARRLAEASGGRVAVHPFHGMRAGEHASAYFARCLGGVDIVPRLAVRSEAAEWIESWWRAHRLPRHTLIIHAGSGSVRKNWEGFAAIATAWRAAHGAVVGLIGPAESDSPHGASLDAVLHHAPLDRVAALLARAERHLGNDSGISHLAGLVGARGAVVFGPTDHRTWRPLGDSLTVVASPDPCVDCGPDRLCAHRVPVERVWQALHATGAHCAPG
jgi:ADP-heptose:LPS heptosyltransferase